MADVDLSGYDGRDGRPVFHCIGSWSAYDSFAGTFDGNGHVISNFSFDANEFLDYAWGLFRSTESESIIKNLHLLDADVTAPEGSAAIGGLVGECFGTISDCRFAGTVSAGDMVGGLAGSVWGGAIYKCCASGDVLGGSNVGGLVGEVFGAACVRDCYATAKVSGSSSVGGLVGYNEGSIATSYSTGTVNGNEDVGGLVGSNDGEVYSSFWDIQTSGQTTSDSGIGKATAEMQTASTFVEVGWDFVGEIQNGTEDIWDICEGVGYPKLARQLGLCPDHPDYSEWVEVGEPICWCYSRQCHGDADGKSQGKQQYWVSTDDLDILIAAWNKTLAQIEGETLNDVPLICADFDHKTQGKQKYRVSTNDLDILIANWNKANAPADDCP
jgi:hypothetical protein